MSPQTPNSSCIHSSAIMILTVRHTLPANGTYIRLWTGGCLIIRNVISVLDGFSTKCKYRPTWWVTIGIYFQTNDYFSTKLRCITAYNTAIYFTNAHNLDPRWISHQPSTCYRVLHDIFINIWNHTEFNVFYAGWSKTIITTCLFKDNASIHTPVLYLSVSAVYIHVDQ